MTPFPSEYNLKLKLTFIFPTSPRHAVPVSSLCLTSPQPSVQYTTPPPGTSNKRFERGLLGSNPGECTIFWRKICGAARVSSARWGFDRVVCVHHGGACGAMWRKDKVPVSLRGEARLTTWYAQVTGRGD
jgi:hypothetical protein